MKKKLKLFEYQDIHPGKESTMKMVLRFEYTYSPLNNTLPKSNLQMHWVSVRFYEISDRQIFNCPIVASKIPLSVNSNP